MSDDRQRALISAGQVPADMAERYGEHLTARVNRAGCTGLCENPEAELCFTADPEWRQAWGEYIDSDRDDETHEQEYQRRVAARERLGEIENRYGCLGVRR